MAVLSREFPLDPSILGEGSAASLSLGASTSADTLASIAVNRPFPAGSIDLAQIAIEAGTGQGIAFQAGPSTVLFRTSAKLQSGVGIFDSLTEAFEGLKIDGPKGLSDASGGEARWAALRWGYGITGQVSVTHPIGVIGAATVGVDASHEGLFAVVHAFDRGSGARDALAETFASWRLPRHVDFDGRDVNLKPGTWLLAEADGSLALTLSARLGYDVSFMHESTLLGLTRDLGATIDANLKTTLGLSVSGRYLVMVGREGSAPRVRVRLQKQAKHGLSFGLNLEVGVKGTPPFPDTFDGFVQTVFGVHGPQVLKELGVVEQWLDPERDLAETASRLAVRTGLDLLRDTTGLDPVERFEDARGKVAAAVNAWNRLPDRVTAMLWGFLSRPPDPERTESFKTLLRGLSDASPRVRQETLEHALGSTALGDGAAASWLQSVATRGLTSLGSDLEGLSVAAGGTLAILENETLQRLHGFISSRLDLDAVRRAVTDTDFAGLDEWLVKRLGDLINASPQLEDLKQIQKAVFGVDAKVRRIYENGVKALSDRYSGTFAAAYQKTATNAALLDAEFDLTDPQSLSVFRHVIRDGALDAVLASPVSGVTLHEGTLSHGLTRTEHVELRLPFMAGTRDRITESLATLEVEEHAGRVLVYEFAASDTHKLSNRARSELSVLGSIRAGAGGMPVLGATGTIAYEARQVKRRLRPAELEHLTRPFIDAYLAPLFTDAASIEAFYAELAMVAAARGGPRPSEDVALSMEVSYPVQVLEGWLRPRDAAALHDDTMHLSRALQASLRRLLARTYFDDLDRLRVQEPVAALLVWASMPVSTSIDSRRKPLRFNTDQEAFWDHAALAERRAVASDPHTATALGLALDRAHARLLAADRDPDQFARARLGRFLELAQNEAGDRYLAGLLHAEALIIAGAQRALRTIAAATSRMDKAPSVAVKSLAEFAGALVDTFSGRLEFVFSPEAMRALGPTLLADASAAVHPVWREHPPAAMLRIYVLAADRAFAAESFLAGDTPAVEDVTAAQTLVSSGT